MKDLRDLKDLTIHDLHQVCDWDGGGLPETVALHKGQDLQVESSSSSSFTSNLLKRGQLLTTHRSPSTVNRHPLQTS